MIGSIYSFHQCLATCKRPRQSFGFFRRYWRFFIQSTFSIPWCACQHPTEITKLICIFHVCLTACKNLHNHSALSQDIGNLLFGSTLGIPRHAWPYPTKNQTISSFHQCLTLCKKLRQSLNSLLRYWQLAISEHLPAHAWPYLTKREKPFAASLHAWLCGKKIETITPNFRHIGSSSFRTTLGMPGYAWLHSAKIM